MEKSEQTKEKIFFTNKSLISNKEPVECFEISIPILIEKKYGFSKGSLIYREKYLFVENEQKILEIKSIANTGTIFYGNTVLSDRNMYLIQEIDPIFIAIYYLDFARGKKTPENEGKFLKLEEIFIFKNEKEKLFYNNLLKNQRLLRGLDLICDKKEIDFDEIQIYYRLNDELLYKWLDLKLDVLTKSMKKHLSHRFTLTETHALEKMQIFDFFYEILPFSIFDDYIVKHHNTPQNEFGKYKSGLNIKKDINTTPDSEDKGKDKSASNQKQKKTKIEKVIQLDKNPITNYFGKKQI